MLLKHIKLSRYSEQVNLCFDNGIILPFSVDEVVRLHLSPGQTLDDARYRQMIRVSVCHLILRYSLRQVAISPKTEKVLVPKLKTHLQKIVRQYHLPDQDNTSIIEEAVTYLRDRQLINEANFVAHIVNKYRHHSSLSLRYRLVSLGVDPDNYRHLLSAHDDSDNIRRLIEKSRVDLADYKAKSRLIGSLARKGFAFLDVKSVIDDVLANR